MAFSGLKTIFRALNHKNYKIYFFGQITSQVGSWMQHVAMGWLVYRITGSAILLGIVAFASQIPSFILSPFAGIVADRYDRYKILIITQSLFMVQALILAALVLTDSAGVTTIIILSVIQGIIMSFDAPARHAFVVQIVDRKDDISNAIALNSTTFHASRLVGPPVAGFIIAVSNEGICFLINGLSYIMVIGALLMIKVKPLEIPKVHKSAANDIRDGFVYAYRSVPIKAILMMVAFASVIGMPYTTLMPVMARDILHGTSQTFGILMGGAGLGALTGALYLASKTHSRGLFKNMSVAPTIFGLGMIGFSISRTVELSLILLVTGGFGMMTIMASSNTIIQSVVHENMRGRVMSLYTFAFMGLLPFGNLLAGAIAHQIGTPATLFISGILCIGASLFFISKTKSIEPLLKGIYDKNGS